MRFIDKTIIVTGGTYGIGRAITLEFAREGAAVFATYINHPDKAQKILQIKEEQSIIGKIEAIQVSVTDNRENMKTINSIKQRFGKIDVLINNADVFHNGYLTMIKSSDCDEMIDINLNGAVYYFMAVTRIMTGQRFGQIINTSSLATFRDFPGTEICSTSNTGIVAFTNYLANELSNYGIKVNGLAPRLDNAKIVSSINNPHIDEYKNNTCIRKILKPAEIARWIMNLVSGNTRIINGETLILYG